MGGFIGFKGFIGFIGLIGFIGFTGFIGFIGFRVVVSGFLGCFVLFCLTLCFC